MNYIDLFVLLVICTGCAFALYFAFQEFYLWAEAEYLDWRIRVNTRKIWLILNK
jgi:hypothetical protein